MTTINNNNIKHEIWENGGGVIFWFVFKNGTPIRCFDGWEYQDDGSIRQALADLAVDPKAYTMWDGDTVESLRDEGDPAYKDCTAKSLYQDFTDPNNDPDASCLYTTDKGYIGGPGCLSARLFADPAACAIARSIQKAEFWEDCREECAQLCDMAGIGAEWNAATADFDHANEDSFLPILEKAADALHVSIG